MNVVNCGCGLLQIAHEAPKKWLAFLFFKYKYKKASTPLFLQGEKFSSTTTEPTKEKHFGNWAPSYY